MKTLLLPLGLFALSVFPAHANETVPATTTVPVTVVELFTSQGCSSCPPANAFVGSLEGDADILVLSYGVTYWDYLGWQDTFGDPAYTTRQRAYNKQLGYGGAYTPEIILNGVVHNSRFRKGDVARNRLDGNRAMLRLQSKDNGEVIVSLDKAGDYEISVVRFTPGPQQVPVKRGENGGRTLTITNVVTDLKVVPLKADTTLTLPQHDGDQYALILQKPDHGSVISALRYTP